MRLTPRHVGDVLEATLGYCALDPHGFELQTKEHLPPAHLPEYTAPRANKWSTPVLVQHTSCSTSAAGRAPGPA